MSPSSGSCSISSSRRPFSRFLSSLLGNQADRAGLRTFFPRLLDKPDSCPDLQTWKALAKNAVFVKVDFASVLRSQKSVTLARENLAYASLRSEERRVGKECRS